ncbi:unnamed protein product [Moneuplotes crassus]|uniref:Uncharacterized protein n=1 Tax=Euplotes crassus TaxID=5936 RepID=A0AAD1TZF7_EUPCR|nr:unnamed protein product [Moneuplotes crassus]
MDKVFKLSHTHCSNFDSESLICLKIIIDRRISHEISRTSQ